MPRAKKSRLVNRKPQAGHILSISFPVNKSGIVDMIDKISKDKTIGMSKSQVVVNSLEYFLGADPYGSEIKIIKKYKSGRLPLDDKRVNINLSSLITYELKRRDISELADYWGVTKQELAYLVYAYVMRNG